MQTLKKVRAIQELAYSFESKKDLYDPSVTQVYLCRLVHIAEIILAKKNWMHVGFCTQNVYDPNLNAHFAP